MFERNPLFNRYARIANTVACALAWCLAGIACIGLCSCSRSAEGASTSTPVAAPQFGNNDFEFAAVNAEGSVIATHSKWNALTKKVEFSAPTPIGVTNPTFFSDQGVCAEKFLGLRTGAIARTADGKWYGWTQHEPVKELALKSILDHLEQSGFGKILPESIVQIVGGQGSVLLLLKDGTVMMLAAEGMVLGGQDAKFSAEHKLDGIVKVSVTCGEGGGLRPFFVRKDGTLWVGGLIPALGWVMESSDKTEKTQMNELVAHQLSGIKDAKDVAINWHGNAHGKGVILLKDGSVESVEMSADNDPDLNLMKVKPMTLPEKGVRVAAGDGAVGVLDSKGHVWVWGYDTERYYTITRPGLHAKGFRAKSGEDISPDEPYMVADLSDVVDISFSSGYHTFAMALKKDGSVWAWNDEPPLKVLDGVKVP